MKTEPKCSCVMILLKSGVHGTKSVLIDYDDLHLVTDKGWSLASLGHGIFYAVNGTNSKKSMHRMIMNPPDGFHVDHINGNGLDNRRSNLRIVTHTQNHWNRQKVLSLSGFKGVSKYTYGNSYRAKITVENKRIHLGTFKTPEEAATAYDVAAIKYFGEFAMTNKKMGLL